MVARNSIPKIDSQLYSKIMDQWVLKLKQKGFDYKNVAELDQLPEEYFDTVINHQEFEALIPLLTLIHHHLDALVTCLARKFNELSAEDRHDLVNKVLLTMHRAELSGDERAVWKKLYEAFVPGRFRRAA